MIAGLDPYITDWLDLLGRWLHVIAAIVWIGTSFYFVALDNHLLPPKRRTDREEGVGGESWEIHGGGFYRIEKYQVAPRVLPEPLHWFKWRRTRPGCRASRSSSFSITRTPART